MCGEGIDGGMCGTVEHQFTGKNGYKTKIIKPFLCISFL